MRLCIYRWSAFALDDVLYLFNKLNIDYDEFSYDFDREGHSKHYDEEFLVWFKENIDTRKYDAIFSIAYWAALSDAAQMSGMKYISWSYDCPLDVQDPFRTLNNECNYIFLFDKIQTNKYKDQGINTVYHLPLGINVDRYKRIKPHSSKFKKYGTDISFVGNLYTGNTAGLKSLVSERSANIIQGIVDTQKKLQDRYILDQLITQQFIDALNMEVELLHPGIVGNFSRDAFENTLAYDVTNYNRLILLMLCAKRFRTDLYTGSKIDNIEGLNIHGKVHYYNEMPWVFATSRINLNSSFISIQSGIPLRALDILASGGLLVSNRQPELADTFIEDKEVVLYTGFDEAIDKISYYLAHEEKRVKILESGRKKVYEKCNMTDRIKEILSISFNE